MTNSTLALEALSQELSSAVDLVGRSVVRIDDGSRFTASGTILTADGLIVATSHGVEADESVAVELHDGTRLSASILGRDDETDLVALKADGAGLTPISRSESPAEVGQLALAVARPGSAGLSATFGVISGWFAPSGGHSRSHGFGRHRRFRTEAPMPKEPEMTASPNVLLTDAILYPGFSGGALVGASGQFLGLLNLGRGRGRSFAISAKLAIETTEALQNHGQVQRGFLGVSTQPVRLPSSANTDQEFGLLISSVEDGSGAAKAGLMIGDILLSLDGEVLENPHGMRAMLRGKPTGTEISFGLLRGGQAIELTATLGARPNES